MSEQRIKVNDIFECLCRALANDGVVTETSNDFYALNSNLERVDFALDLLKKYNINATFAENKKSEALSVKYRQDGNEKYKTKNDHQAWLLYNKSIAYAPTGTETLGLAFANRSAVLSEKNFHKECIQDINNAFANHYPEKLHDKLNQRKERSKWPTKPQTNFTYYEKVPSLTFPNQYIRCATSAVEIKHNEELGRHVVASRDIVIGEILAIEKPFAQILLKDCIYTHCVNCLTVCFNLIPCPSCSYAMFCSEKCLVNAWKTYHEYECPIMTTLLNLEITKLNFLALRVAIQARDKYSTIHKLKAHNKVYKSGVYEEIHFLEANTHLRNSADLFPRSVTAGIIFKLLEEHSPLIGHFKDGKEDQKIFKELLLRHMQTGPTNFHEISECAENEIGDYESNEIGAGAYSFLSLLNHSCDPNVVRNCHGTTIVLRALRPIKKGVELLDNYGYHYAVTRKADRQRELKKRYFFTCSCEACERNWPLFSQLRIKNEGFGLSEGTLTDLMRGDMDAVSRVMWVTLSKASIIDDVRPCKTLATLQETIRRCYSLLGSKWARL